MIKSQLWTSWAPKSVEVFNRIPPIFINGDADAYYRSIATLQVGRQGRGDAAACCFRTCWPRRCSLALSKATSCMT